MGKIKRKCFLACPINSASGEKFSLFQAPRDENVFNEWKKSIKCDDREFAANHHVCERHFKETQVNKSLQLFVHGEFLQEVFVNTPYSISLVSVYYTINN